MIKEEYIATIVENCGSGHKFGSIMHANTPEGLKDEVVHYLETEKDERDLDIDYDEGDILLACLHGNESSGPDIINVKDWDTEFILLTKKICITVDDEIPIHVLTELYEDDGQASAHSSIYTDLNEARTALREGYEETRSKGDINQKIYPGMFSNATDEELCDGCLEDHIFPDHINVWDGNGYAYEGRIVEKKLKL